MRKRIDGLRQVGARAPGIEEGGEDAVVQLDAWPFAGARWGSQRTPVGRADAPHRHW